MITEDLLMLMGENGLQILETMQLGPVSVDTIHLLTGLPVACISTRIPVMEKMGLISKLKSSGEYELKALGHQLLDIANHRTGFGRPSFQA
jgi:DNA-binding IclR family transcriptional regulator